MLLLIPCSEHIDRNKLYDFDKIPGELLVNVSRFREQVTAFCLGQGETMRWPSTEILQKAKRYVAYNTFLMDTFPTTTYSVLVDICNRSIQKDHDRIALLANALRFSTRLDTSDRSPLVTSDDYSLSTALLALVLLNGEILSNDNDIPGTILGHDLQSYLEDCEYPFDPPLPRNEQSFVDHCRFKSPTITHQGIRTQGWVFKLSSVDRDVGRSIPAGFIELTAYEKRALDRLAKREQSLSCEPRSTLNELEQAAVETLIYKLERTWPGCNLVKLMQRNLKIDRDPPSRGKETAAVLVFLKLLAAVVQELIEGRMVRLARLYTELSDSPPSAIFVTPEHGWTIEGFETVNDPVYLFTSWENRKDTPRNERLASLRVGVVGGNDTSAGCNEMAESCSLRNYGWVNGIWDVRGKSMETFTFPLKGVSGSLGAEESKPEVLPKEQAEHAWRKRKRVPHDDGRSEIEDE